MSEIVITEFMDVAAVASLEADFDVLYAPELFGDRELLLASVTDCKSLIVRNRTSVDADLLDAAPDLVIVGRLGVGLDNIDVDQCRVRDIELAPAIGANTDSVVEYVVAAIFVLTRGVFRASDAILRGEWPRNELIGSEIADRTLGLVGFGEIAKKVAMRMGELGMQVIAHDPFIPGDDPAWRSVERVDMASLAERSDAISIHVPLTSQTAGMFGKEAIGSMRDSAVLINTSRGGIVDEDELVAALSEGRLGGAALDVFETEPVDRSYAERFVGVPNLVLTPHIAGVTVESNERVSRHIADKVRLALSGSTP